MESLQFPRCVLPPSTQGKAAYILRGPGYFPRYNLLVKYYTHKIIFFRITDVDEVGKSSLPGSPSLRGSVTEDLTKINKFKVIYRVLVDMKIKDQNVLKRLASELQDCDPCTILLNPLKNRFKFHFLS